MNHLESQVKSAMQAVLDHLKSELKTLRTGRANASILDKIHVEVYGSHSPLKSVANINVPEPRQIVVTPFDHTNANAIAKAIQDANLGVNPIVDGKVIRINVPPMDQTARQQMAKQAKKFAEEAKVAFREVRRKYNEAVRQEKTKGVIGEDEMKKSEKTIQDLTDKFCREADTISGEKEKEIMVI